ncbi:small terminase protein [uncultured Caudovirales phage]|uniref:Small terminase protein n=1 Tax=uncultured Caudovirales phage TaxID=2100421 RepID=A0A6J5KPW7_9CAUD|nr:small terminase protein [uncultured Caudovirales phage]
MNSQTSDDKLAELFDVTPISNSKDITIVDNASQSVVSSSSNEKEDDFQYVRTNLYDLINKGSEAVSNALSVAQESQHPRAYEVAGNLIKNIADLTDKLVALQKTKQMLSPQEEFSPKNVNIDKAVVVFNGSTAELLKMIKNESDSNK